MSNPAADYKIIGVRSGGVTSTSNHQGAPSEAWLCEWGKRRGCQAVIRYFPSRRGWRVLDIRDVQAFGMPGVRRPVYSGQVRGTRYWPTEDAAVMAAIHTMAGHS